MNKRREDVVYTSAAIMNRPKPRPKATETPASGQETPKEEPKKDDKMDVEQDGPSIEEMDVD
jgi:heat shock protein 4